MFCDDILGNIDFAFRALAHPVLLWLYYKRTHSWKSMSFFHFLWSPFGLSFLNLYIYPTIFRCIFWYFYNLSIILEYFFAFCKFFPFCAPDSVYSSQCTCAFYILRFLFCTFPFILRESHSNITEISNYFLAIYPYKCTHSLLFLCIQSKKHRTAPFHLLFWNIFQKSCAPHRIYGILKTDLSAPVFQRCVYRR